MSKGNYTGAVGIGVADLATSVAFYRDVLGMRELMTFSLPHMEEVVLGWGRKGASIVLMQYTDGSDPVTTNLPVKLVLYVEDPVAIAATIRDAGYPIEREPEPVPTLNNAMIGFAKDPDGYLLELLQAPAEA